MKKMMNLKKGIAVLLTAVIAVSGFAISNVYAAKAIDFSNEAVLTIALPENTYAELETNDINISLYKVADVDKTGAYTACEAFDTVFIEENINDKTTASDWREMAEKCAKSVSTQMKPVNATIGAEKDRATVTFTGEEFGMYLMIVQDVNTEQYKYSFEPSLVAVPGNNYYLNGDDSWIYGTDSSKPLQAVLKPEYEDALGNLVIRKELKSFNESLSKSLSEEGKKVIKDISFVYKVTAYKDYSAIDKSLNNTLYKTETEDEEGNKTTTEIPAKLVYSNVFAMNFPGVGSDEISIPNLPAGSVVFVEEAYTGATYQADVESHTLVIVKEDTVSAEFTNNYNNGLTGNGTAVVNTFKNDGTKWSWSNTTEIEQ